MWGAGIKVNWYYTAAPEVLFFSKGTYLVARTLLVRVCGGANGNLYLVVRGAFAFGPACAAPSTEVNLTPGRGFLMSDCVRAEP